jgi:hypothetical protein
VVTTSQELKQKDEDLKSIPVVVTENSLSKEEEKKERPPSLLSRIKNSLSRDKDISSSSKSNLHSMDGSTSDTNGTSDTNYQIQDLRKKLSDLRRFRVSAVVVAECETRARARRWLQTSSGRRFLFKRATELMKSQNISESEAIREASDEFIAEKAKQDGEEVSKAYMMKIRRLEANFRAQRRVGV